MTKTIFFAVLMTIGINLVPALAQEKPAVAPEAPVSVTTETPAAAPVAPSSPPAPAVPPAPALNDAQKAAALAAMQEAVQKAKANIEADPYSVDIAKPAIIDAAAKRGAQVQYIGERNDFSGWVIIEQGEPAYIYVSRDEKTIFRGLMFDEAGKPVTIEQIAEAQLRNPEFFGLTEEEAMAQSNPATPANAAASTTPDIERKPSEVLYDALAVSNYFVMGSKAANAPVLYAFLDPDCPHCKDFLKDIDKKFLTTEKMQLRVIPIGILGDESAARAAYLLALPDPAAALRSHIDGSKPLLAPQNATLEGQQLNVDLFKLWRFDGTPILVFKAKDGTIMLVRGAPKDMQKTLDMIAPGAPS